MFVGKFYNSIDDKSRLIVPAKFRDELGGKCVMARSLDRCLTIYTLEEWQKFVEEKLEKLPTGKADTRRFKRFFYSSAAECDVDKQGRLTIPQELKDYAEIEKDLVTIGSNRTIEVWSKEQFDEGLDPETNEVMNLDEVAESMEQYGF
ncbi:MAG: division/cell wall cluster transcriptional repressor MraZ [Bacillota bacterium]|nr:division/cell wall cluster transcriptional repressor MraZ [Bacillota bacterium]